MYVAKKWRRNKAHSLSGFTLIELMIGVALISILVSAAMPSFKEALRNSRKDDGIATVLMVMQAQERFFSENKRYTNQLTELGFATDNNLLSQKEYYQVSASACGTQTLVECVLVTGQPVRVGDFVVSIDNTGKMEIN